MDGSIARCFHCAEALPAHGVRSASIDGVPRQFCCAGCEAVAILIRDTGLIDYYRVRSAPAQRAAAIATDFSGWNSEAVQLTHVRSNGSRREITVLVEGIRCAACSWLIENAMLRESGVGTVQVNPATARATLGWESQQTTLADVLGALQRLGYTAHLPGAEGNAAAVAQRRTALKRLLVAGLGMMQGMMFAEALYFGDGGDMDLATRDFFRWIGLLVSMPVVFYSGWPFLRGAWLEWRLRQPGMDLLVSSMVLLAWSASVVETLRGGPAVYFDAAVMFVFLLLATRHLEQTARQRANAAVDVLARAQPQSARRVDGDAVVDVPVHALVAGDVVRVRPGEAVPADGVLQSERGAFGEALLSGESRPIQRCSGEPVLAGSLCLDTVVDVAVTRVGSQTTLAQMVRLVERAQAARPRAARIADRIASHFVVVLFVATVVIGIVWWMVDPSQVLPVVLAVLAVSCPCALSLAVPAGLAATHARLAREGILVVQPDALETLARVDRIVLDKTGTLSSGRMSVAGVVTQRDFPRAQALAIAAALERDSLHPLASGFRPFTDDAVIADSVQTTAGLGVQGRIGDRLWRLGSAAFTQSDAAPDLDAAYLADEHGVVARFAVADTLREDAAEACAALRAMGIEVEILSGDVAAVVAQVAASVGVQTWSARQTPDAKLAAVRAMQDEGSIVAMVGDGINDAAVLAGAQVSIAMAEGAPLAHAAADVVLATPRLLALPGLFRAARDARRITRQNLSWAIAYNAIGLVLAAFGLVPPWAAAIGMSISSLAVTLNALRLAMPERRRMKAPAPARRIAPAAT
jgi:Cu2+-exporting ATPase